MPFEVEVWNIQMIYQTIQQACLNCVMLKNYINFQNLATKPYKQEKVKTNLFLFIWLNFQNLAIKPYK